MMVFLQRLFSSILFGKIGVIEISTNAVKYLAGNKLTDKFNFKDYTYGTVFTDSGRLGMHNGRLSLKFLCDVILPAINFSTKTLIKAGVKKENIRIISTALLREANNADECVKIIEERTGLPVRVIPPEEEAVGGISAFMRTTKHNLEGKYVVGVDIGGGSTEVAVIKNNRVVFKRSFRVGMSLGQKEPIILPSDVFKDKRREIILVGNGFCLKKALGISSNNSVHDKVIPIASLESLYNQDPKSAPLADVYIDLANQLNCSYMIGNGTGNIYAELLDKKLN